MIVVNSSTRQFNIPGADMTFGVEADNGSERKVFQCPRYVGNGLDVAGSFVRINYRNANGEIDSYLVNDVTVDGDNITFTWELSPKVTAYKGQIRFVMCVTGPDAKVAWHTTLGTGVVLEGLEPDYVAIQADTTDVVAQLIALVGRQTAAVTAEGTNQVTVVKNAAKAAETASVAEIEAKGANVRESIPDDYTALSEAVDGLVRGRAPGIVCSAEGTAIAVADASNMAMQGLRVFGRSTQDGVPSPASPVEIKSVEAPVVTVAGKNLLNADLMINDQFVKNADGTYTLTKNGASNLRFSKRAACSLPSGTYIMSVASVTDTENIVRLALTFASGKELSVAVTPNIPKTIVVDEEITKFAAYIPSDRSDGSYTTFSGLMLERGSVATPYETYKPIQTITTTYTLPGVPVTSGGNYTDSNGQQWLCDEVDLERGVLIRRLVTHVLSGDMLMYVWTDTERERGITVRGLSMDYSEGKEANALCSHYKTRANGSITLGQIGIRRVGDYPSLYLLHEEGVATTISEWKTYLNAQIANGTPVTVLAKAEAVTEVPLTETEIAAYRAMHTNKPYTTVLNSAGAHMAVEYVADTKLYIDNKIKEVLR